MAPSARVVIFGVTSLEESTRWGFQMRRILAAGLRDGSKATETSAAAAPPGRTPCKSGWQRQSLPPQAPASGVTTSHSIVQNATAHNSSHLSSWQRSVVLSNPPHHFCSRIALVVIAEPGQQAADVAQALAHSVLLLRGRRAFVPLGLQKRAQSLMTGSDGEYESSSQPSHLPRCPQIFDVRR